MIALDEDALVCDFAETYRIYDFRALPARLAATYAAGLRHDARIMEKVNGIHVPIDTLLLATIADGVHVRVWQQSKAAADGAAAPESIVKSLLGTKEEKEYHGFDSPEDYWEWRKSILGD